MLGALEDRVLGGGVADHGASYAGCVPAGKRLIRRALCRGVEVSGLSAPVRADRWLAVDGHAFSAQDAALTGAHRVGQVASASETWTDLFEAVVHPER